MAANQLPELPVWGGDKLELSGCSVCVVVCADRTKVGRPPTSLETVSWGTGREERLGAKEPAPVLNGEAERELLGEEMSLEGDQAWSWDTHAGEACVEIQGTNTSTQSPACREKGLGRNERKQNKENLRETKAEK